MSLRNDAPFETLGFKLPAAVAGALHRRVSSHAWNPDRVVAASILYFIENADARVDMLRRLIEVQGGAPTHTPPEDVLEHHRDEVFGSESGDMTTDAFEMPFPVEDISPVEEPSPAEEPIHVEEANHLEEPSPVEAVCETVPQELDAAAMSLDQIAANLARFTDEISDDTPC